MLFHQWPDSNLINISRLSFPPELLVLASENWKTVFLESLGRDGVYNALKKLLSLEFI